LQHQGGLKLSAPFYISPNISPHALLSGLLYALHCIKMREAPLVEILLFDFESSCSQAKTVITGLDPVIHALLRLDQRKTWMAGHWRAEATPSFGRYARP
jgi:hypothetical protein